MTLLQDFALSEQQMERIDMLERDHQGTTFVIVAKYEHSRAIAVEHEDLGGSGVFLLTANGRMHVAPDVLP